MILSPLVWVKSAAAAKPLGVSGWDKAGVIIAAVAALLTLAAVTVALYGPAWWERRRRPELTPKVSDCAVETVLPNTGSSVPGGRALYQRLLVENEAKKNDAQDVQLIVERFYVAPDNVHLRIPLIWTHSDPVATRTTIPSGYGMFVDLLAIRADEPGVLVLQVHPQPAGGQHRLSALEAGTWEIEAALLAKGVPQRPYRIEVEYDGAWRPGAEPGDHLHVSVRLIE